MVIKRYNFNSQVCNFVEVTSEDESADFTLKIEKTKETELGTHKITINDGAVVCLENWKFRPETLFCTNSGGLRIEISAINSSDNEQYNFYIVGNYIPEDKESTILEALIDLLLAIVRTESIEEFDSQNKWALVRRLDWNQ